MILMDASPMPIILALGGLMIIGAVVIALVLITVAIVLIVNAIKKRKKD